ncbi:hypothetical protein [Streptomyces albus]|uniref:hypothetical protein n=1 Tax=Streptomyces sp. PHES57 TaxID=2872626 RepID=UPI001CEDE8F2|nr:hypothetical protein [Streptomyces sp. PHES57]
MLPEIVEVIRAFEVADQVLFSQVDSSTAVLIPEDSGCAVIVQDRGDTVTVRTGLDVSVNIDPEEEDFTVLLRDLLAALRDGKAEERLATVYRNRLAPDGYKVEYASGSMQEFGERSGREYAVRLPAWNAS